MFVVCVGVQFGASRIAGAIDDLGELIAAMLAAAACAHSARRPLAGSRGWAYLSAACLAWGCGEAVWSYYDLVRGIEVPFPSLADAGFLLAIPLGVIGLLLLSPPAGRRTGLGWVATALAATIGLLVFWTVLSEAGGPGHGGETFSLMVSGAYPAGDLAMMCVVAVALGRGSVHRASLSMVLAGVVAITVSDSSFAYLTATNDYGIGNVLDTGWVIGFLMIALGAAWAGHIDSPRIRRTRQGLLEQASALRPLGSISPVAMSAAPLGLIAVPRSSWLTPLIADRMVYSASLLLMLADSGLVLYDLSLILRGLL